MNRKYYKRINNLDIALEKTNHKYIMINQWAMDNSHKWEIASFIYDEDEDCWYFRTYGNFNANVDWYDFDCLVKLGCKWIKDGCFNNNPESLGGES